MGKLSIGVATLICTNAQKGAEQDIACLDRVRVHVGKGLAGCVEHLENALQGRALKRLSGQGLVVVPQDAAQRVDKQCVHANQHKAACLHDDQFPDQICISGDSCSADV